MKIIFISILLFFCTYAHGQVIKDTLFFINGTIVIGEIKKVKLGTVTFDPDDANDITVQLRKLKTLSTGGRIFRVETVNHKVYFGKLIPQTTLNTARIVTTTDTLVLSLEQISFLYPFERSLWQRFSGLAGIGFNFTKSSGFGRLNFNGSVNYSSKKNELGFSISGIYTLTDTTFTRDRMDINLKDNYYFRRNWFATVFLTYQHNLELGLQRRYQEGLGIGNKLITSKHVYAWARTGLAFSQEKSTEEVSSGNLTEIFAQFEMNIFRFAKPEINFILSEAVFYSLSQSDRFRNDGEINLTWEIFKDFDLSLELYNNFDSQPPVEGSDKMDYGIVFGINFSF